MRQYIHTPHLCLHSDSRRKLNCVFYKRIQKYSIAGNSEKAGTLNSPSSFVRCKYTTVRSPSLSLNPMVSMCLCHEHLSAEVKKLSFNTMLRRRGLICFLMLTRENCNLCNTHTTVEQVARIQDPGCVEGCMSLRIRRGQSSIFSK